MAEVADITKVQDEALEALAVEKGLDLAKFNNKEELAAAVSPLVTPEEVAALPQIESESEDEGNDTPPADGNDQGESDEDKAAREAQEAEDAKKSEEEAAAEAERKKQEEADAAAAAKAEEEADEFPKTVHVRLSKGYPLEQAHRRAGVSLSPGPEPVAVEVTEEQLALLESDRYVELVSDEEVESWKEHRAAVNGSAEVEPVSQLAPQTTHDDVNNVGAGVPSGRRYDTGVNGGADPESTNPDGSIQSERTTRQPKAAEAPKAGDLKKHADIVAYAQQIGITPTNFVKGDLLKQAIKTAQSDGVEKANEELAEAIEKAKAEKAQK